MAIRQPDNQAIKQSGGHGHTQAWRGTPMAIKQSGNQTTRQHAIKQSGNQAIRQSDNQVPTVIAKLGAAHRLETVRSGGEVDAVRRASLLDVGPIEVVAVVGHDHVGAQLAQVLAETREERGLGWLVEDGEGAGVLGLGRVLERVDLGGDDLA
eukprot:6512702-Prymnesium_polylepis.1